ncbi:MAG: carboxypeptidase regulatory-like domain-containing protein [Spirochaetes bacterium]|nr:carboxypeptidase regulatory-like domain-containing protein [Spirochaetota bacterium]
MHPQFFKTARIASLFILVATALSCATTGREVLPDGRAVYKKAGSADIARSEVIEGTVTDAATRKGIRGATVEIKNANMGMGYYRLETDSSGAFRIVDFIKHVRYRIEISANGYVPYITTESISAGRYAIELRREGILEGMVRDSAGAPIAGVEVKLSSEYGGEHDERPMDRPLIATSDAGGKYSFSRLAEGSYAVAFAKTGYITETAVIQRLKSGERFALPMRLFRPASIAGSIAIQNVDSPAVNMNITLKGRVTHATVSYHDGSYRIDDIKPGTYAVSLSHEGFHALDAPPLAIQEGAQINGFNFTVRPKEPQLQVYAYRYTFAPGMKVEFNLKTIRLEKVNARIYRVPLGLILSGRVDPNKLDVRAVKLQAVREWELPVQDFQPYEWRYQAMDLSEPLPAGAYCVEVAGAGRAVDRKFFTVTSTGLVVKRSRESVFAYVTSLVTNEPVPNASVVVFDNTPVKQDIRARRTATKPPERIEDLPVKIVHRGKTDAGGVFHHPLKSGMHLSVLAVAPDNSYAFASTGSPYSFAQEESKYFVYTDRPVYRAGDTVFYKIIGKKRERRFAPLSSSALQYEIRNADFDETIQSGTMTLDQWGTYGGSIKLDGEARLGEHHIRVGKTAETLYGSGRFYVEQYRKPEFKIDISPARPYFINGDTAEFRVDAKYFFGAPLKGALVKYRFYESRLRDTDTTYWWEEDYGHSEAYNRIKLEGDRYLDDNGVAALRLACGSFPYDREITLEATIVDRSNVSITSRASVKVGRGDFYIKINPAQSFFADDEKKIIDVKTTAHDGAPVSAPVEVKVFRYLWKPWQRVYVHDKVPVFERKFQTDAKGAFRLELPKKFDLYGEFDIIAAARDRRENEITASRVVWVYSSRGARVDSRFKNLELSVDRPTLDKPGEITCLLKSRFPDAWVCLTVEGRDVYEKKVVRMTGNVMPVKMLIKDEYAPNCYITATMQRSRALFTSSAGVTLPDADTRIMISITPAKEKYLPGEKATVRFEVDDENGKPLRADLSLGVVDEAIYSIRHDHTPKMLDFFYAKISNWVLTNYSYPITVLAGAAKEGKVKVREKFEDTAFWRADIRTGDDGRAEVSFDLPDNLTTWRLTARGHDLAGRVGERRSEILVTQDLIARVGKPRFMVEGDTVGLVGIVNSNTTRGLPDVKTELKADDAPVQPDESVRMSLPAFGSARAYYTVKAPEGKDSMKLLFSATADTEARDALALSIPVHSRGVPYALYGVGDMAENRTVSVKPPPAADDFDFVPSEIVISLNPGPIARMAKAARYLAEYPFGCVEQNINRFLPAIALKSVLKKRGMEGLIAGLRVEETATAGLERVQRAQNDDGSWGWWSGDRGNEFLTGYALYALHTAKRLGYPVENGRVVNALQAVERMLTDAANDRDAAAYLLYVYALYGRWNDPAFRAIAADKKPTAYTLSFLVRALALGRNIRNLQPSDRERLETALPRALDALRNMQKRDARGVYWEALPSHAWIWQGGSVELTAHVLESLVVAGDRSPLPAQILGSISRRGRDDRWNSTKETATVILAACRQLEALDGGSAESGTVAFSLDGKPIASISYDTGSMKDLAALSRRVAVPATAAVEGYTIIADGSAGGEVSFDVTLRGNLYFKSSGFMSLFKSEERSMRSLENGIGLSRGFHAVTRVRDINNNEYLVPQAISSSAPIRVGDEIMVKVRFRAQDDFEYLVLEDYLPSGFEVVMNNAYDEYQPYSHSERRDNRMVFFFTRISKGEIYEIAYIMRAELPGRFLVKPARIECMYEPSIQGWAVPARFSVEKK